MHFQDVLSMAPADIRAAIPRWAAAHVDAEPAVQRGIAADIERILRGADDAALQEVLEAYRVAGESYRFFPGVPLARRMSRALISGVVKDVDVEGLAHVDAFMADAGRRRLVVCNHLSYADTQVTDLVLARLAREGLADRLVAIAGPKVYSDAWRRWAAVALNTRKTAQSSSVATEQDALSPRALAAIARETLDDCDRLMDEGWVVLLYPEGTRSRDGRLQPFLRAAGRYLQLRDVRILPMSITGTEHIHPRDAVRMVPSAVRVAFGPAFDGDDAAGAGTVDARRGALAEAHARIGALLPPAHRPLALSEPAQV
jgi:1-acyl-sn-glycerol-3-phosphate acyltransferase